MWCSWIKMVILFFLMIKANKLLLVLMENHQWFRKKRKNQYLLLQILILEVRVVELLVKITDYQNFVLKLMVLPIYLVSKAENMFGQNLVIEYIQLIRLLVFQVVIIYQYLKDQQKVFRIIYQVMQDKHILILYLMIGLYLLLLLLVVIEMQPVFQVFKVLKQKKMLVLNLVLADIMAVAEHQLKKIHVMILIL